VQITIGLLFKGEKRFYYTFIVHNKQKNFNFQAVCRTTASLFFEGLFISQVAFAQEPAK